MSAAIRSESKTSAIVRMEIRSVDRLLAPDATPFPGPRLDSEAGARILSDLRSSPKARNFLIEFVVPPADLGRGEEIRAALSILAREAMDHADEELHEIFKNGRVSLFVGFLAVAGLLGITELLLLIGGDSTTIKAIAESLIIVYWVILWRPAELLLYEHFPVRRRRRAARALARAELRLIAAESAPGPMRAARSS